MCGAVTNYCRNTISYIRWDGMHSDFRQRTMQLRWGVHPAVSTAENVKNIKRQINEIAALYDWDMEVNTTDPEFYKWTQWIFVKMFKEGLAYEKEFPINWCPSCKTGLANEEVVNGKCERCGTEVTKKNLRQWMLRITKYAERLLADLDKLDWPEKVKKMQAEWIGKSFGAEVDFSGRRKRRKNYSLHNKTGYTARSNIYGTCTGTRFGSKPCNR